MPGPRTNRIAEFRKKARISQTKLAEMLGVHWVTLSKMERGKAKFTYEWAEKIAPFLRVEPFDLMLTERPISKILISGEIRPGGYVVGYDEEAMPTKVIMSGLFDDPEVHWAIVRGSGLYPFFHEGDLLRLTFIYTAEHRLGAEETAERTMALVGRFCLVETKATEQFIGILAPGSEVGAVDLHNTGYPPLRNMHPVALAQITMAIMPMPTHPLAP